MRAQNRMDYFGTFFSHLSVQSKGVIDVHIHKMPYPHQGMNFWILHPIFDTWKSMSDL